MSRHLRDRMQGDVVQARFPMATTASCGLLQAPKAHLDLRWILWHVANAIWWRTGTEGPGWGGAESVQEWEVVGADGGGRTFDVPVVYMR